MTRLSVQSVGVLALLQDHGRRGLAHLGVAPSGAADRASFDRANRLVGNRPGAACIEVTLGRFAFSVDKPVLVAATGARVEIRCGARAQAVETCFPVNAGDTVTLGAPAAGLRTYVAVRGGIAGEDVLGSVSWDMMARLGTAPLRSRDVFDIGDDATDWPATDQAPVAAIDADLLELPLLLGPRDDWFSPVALDRLAREEFVVTTDADRVGIRLDGPDLPRQRDGELSSEGVVLGALQVPSRGRPTLFMADRPVTGGYPVIGVVPREGVNRAAQAVPGMRIRFAVSRFG